jgi:tetratricopeptide (TPR) repeat protein
MTQNSCLRRFSGPRLLGAILISVLALAGCAGAEKERSARGEPLFEGIGPHRRTVATDSESAQAYFDQGLAFLYAFNHDEAIRSFRQAAKLEPGADRALIEAVATRYASPQPDDRTVLDRAFAKAMRQVHEAYPDDADVAALYAEALMDLHPWDLYEQDGTAKSWTPEIVALLEELLGQAPDHPLAIHLYIHAVEASDEPGRADGPAERLRDLMPGLGHMVHMPSHIDVRRGRWHEALLANTRAVEADRVYSEAAQVPPDFYRLYMSHNHHMRAYAAMMTGQREEALRSIRELVAGLPEDWLRENAGWADGFVAMPYEVLIRFGRWEEILSEPEPPAYVPFTRAMHFAARAVALAALDRTEAARAEQRRFETLREEVPLGAIFGNNSADDLLGVAELLVEGEILYREGEAERGIGVLYEAVAREDALRYDEPPDWIQPIRHALGATLMQEGRYGEAEEVYREDLAKLPDNGWSLFGLARSLRLQEPHGAEAATVEARLAEIWRDADTRLESSCFCQPGV